MIDYQKHRERLTRARSSLTRPHLSFSTSDAAELMDKAEEMEEWRDRAEKLTLISADTDARVKKYWLALEKLSYKCSDGWSGDDCADYAREAIKDFVPGNVNNA